VGSGETKPEGHLWIESPILGEDDLKTRRKHPYSAEAAELRGHPCIMLGEAVCPRYLGHHKVGTAAGDVFPPGRERRSLDWMQERRSTSLSSIM
jgi:hypothetical protein